MCMYQGLEQMLTICLQHYQGCSKTPKCAYVIYGQPLKGLPHRQKYLHFLVTFIGRPLTLDRQSTPPIVYVKNKRLKMNFAARSGRAVARDLRSKMSGMQLPIVKSFRVSLCEEPPKFFFCWNPKRGCKSVFEVSQLVQAGCVASFTHFNIASCIRDKVSP